jgi:protein-disulfide isomerase
VPASESASSHPDQDAPAERNTVLLLVIGGLAAISAVIAGLVIFSSSEAPAEKPEAAAPVSAVDQSVVVGRSSAPTKVAVYEDFASPESREFEIASRDFLRIEAARGRVQVAYRPYVASGTAFSSEAMQAWGGVLGAGTPKQALAFHDVLFDRQTSSGDVSPDQLLAWAKDKGIADADVLDAMGKTDETLIAEANRAAREAGAQRPPLVLLDGAPLSAATPTELADTLQRRVLKEER